MRQIRMNFLVAPSNIFLEGQNGILGITDDVRLCLSRNFCIELHHCDLINLIPTPNKPF